MLKSNKICALIVCSLAIGAYAEQGDRDQPMHIESDQAYLDQKAHVGTFTGNVVLVQGTMRLRADKVTVREDAEGNQFSEGKGAPVVFRQKMDKSADYLEAQALRFDYNGKTGILKLYDNASIKRGVDDVQGDIIVYDLNQETYAANAHTENRVNITITPKKKNHAAVGKTRIQADQSGADTLLLHDLDARTGQ